MQVLEDFISDGLRCHCESMGSVFEICNWPLLKGVMNDLNLHLARVVRWTGEETNI